jgi:hypothetical protein
VLWPAGWIESDLSGGLDGHAALLLLALGVLRARWGVGGVRLVAAGAALGLASTLLP